jgi:hypothetical protein
MKWVLAALVAGLVGMVVYMRLDTNKSTYVNGLAPYTTLPGRNFVVEKDCYIFKLKSEDSNWPLLGAHDTVPELPTEVKESNVGADIPGVRILDVVRVGDHFRLASVVKHETRKKTSITFEIVLENESTRKFPRLDAYWIMDHSPEKDGLAPTIMTSYAVLLGRE